MPSRWLLCRRIPRLIRHIGDLTGQQAVFHFRGQVVGVFQLRVLVQDLVVEILDLQLRGVAHRRPGEVHAGRLPQVKNGGIKLLLDLPSACYVQRNRLVRRSRRFRGGAAHSAGIGRQRGRSRGVVPSSAPGQQERCRLHGQQESRDFLCPAFHQAPPFSVCSVWKTASRVRTVCSSPSSPLSRQRWQFSASPKTWPVSSFR